jgi:predicted DNA-binding protein (MmcQ/YjbR family)
MPGRAATKRKPARTPKTAAARTKPRSTATALGPQALEWLRRLTKALPATEEKVAWGHPTFRVAGKIFASIGGDKDGWAMSFKTAPEVQQYLVGADDRFRVAPYVGKHGWVSLRLEGSLNWGEVKLLVLDSYRQIAPKKVLLRFRQL